MDRKSLFLGIGLTEKFVQEFLKNASKSSDLESLILEAGIAESGCSASVGALLLELSTKLNKPSKFAMENRKKVLEYIVDGKISSIPQVTAAIEYLKKSNQWNVEEFEKKCGVGVVVKEEDIENEISGRINANLEAIRADRYQFDLMSILRAVREKFPWAEGKLVKQTFDRLVESVLGPKTEDDVEKAKKKSKKESNKKVAAKSQEKSSSSKEEIEDVVEFIEKHYSGRELPEAINSESILEEHNKLTGGKIRTRFPPEPNGFLHIGHAKAMNFNFGIASRSGGDCFLRFDDTNPSAEEKRFIDNIIENVHWLGHKPYDITYSSDYFPILYEMAIELIKRGKAYVCHQTQDEIKEFRKKKNKQDPSPWRDRSVEENLRLFDDMRKGKFNEGEATLRMKIDITSINPCMWDPVAYRIKYEEHPHVGDKWCIYPSYDFTHCLVDSIEHITNSCCTLEFEIRRDSYYWLLAALDLYRPMVWEYSRLNITYNVLSKRKLKYLVTSGLVRGWDDPRLLTLNGLRRRGYSPEAINDFCARIGVSRTTTGYTQFDLLEACCRYDMGVNAPRTMAVIDPVKVVITNWDENKIEEIEIADFPKGDKPGSHKVKLTKVVFIERSDFRENDDKEFFGLAPGKSVRLKYAHIIKCVDYEKNSEGKVTQINVVAEPVEGIKVKGNLHWVSGPEPISVEIRVFNPLFSAEFPGAKNVTTNSNDNSESIIEDGDAEEELDADANEPSWTKELNPDSEVIYPNALVDQYMIDSKLEPLSRFQFERIGYFVVDYDSDLENNRFVFNRTVALKSSKDKK